MWAAASGHSTLGIPESVGKEFASADPGGKLKSKVEDMSVEERSTFRRLIDKFFGEESREREHQAADGDWERRGRAASVAFTTSDGRVLLLRRSASDDHRPGQWGFPGGKSEDDEDFEATARREAEEEVGDCTFDGISELDRCRTPNDFEHRTFVVPVKDTFDPRLSDEHDDFRWVPVTDLPEATHPGVRWTIDGVILDKNRLSRLKDVSKGDAVIDPDRRVVGKEPTERGRFVRDALNAVEADMDPEEFAEVSRLLSKFFSEEAQEPEHREAEDAALLEEIATALALDRWVMALDEASNRRLDDSGRMHVDVANICEARIDDYYGREINGVMDDDPDWVPLEPDRKYRVLRDPEELKKPETIKSANGIPILSTHLPTSASDHKFRETVGSTGTEARWDPPHVKNGLVFWPQAAINDVHDGSKAQLSPGYAYRADPTPGTYEGEPYDLVMRDIIFNHLAQVPQGRQGPRVVVPDANPDWNSWLVIERAILFDL